jgi:hypothetical protein
MPSQKVVLTGEHISILERYSNKFRTANPSAREKIIKGAADRIKRTWTGDMFDRDAVISVRELSAIWITLIFF